MIEPSMGQLFNKLDNPSIYSSRIIQASNFCSEPYLKRFGTSQLEFEMDKLY